jgi:hypothetical protein
MAKITKQPKSKPNQKVTLYNSKAFAPTAAVKLFTFHLLSEKFILKKGKVKTMREENHNLFS